MTKANAEKVIRDAIRYYGEGVSDDVVKEILAASEINEDTVHEELGRRGYLYDR